MGSIIKCWQFKIIIVHSRRRKRVKKIFVDLICYTHLQNKCTHHGQFEKYALFLIFRRQEKIITCTEVFIRITNIVIHPFKRNARLLGTRQTQHLWNNTNLIKFSSWKIRHPRSSAHIRLDTYLKINVNNGILYITQNQSNLAPTSKSMLKQYNVLMGCFAI